MVKIYSKWDCWENLNYKNGVIKSIPKKWSEKDIKDLLYYKEKKFNNEYIWEIMGRTAISIWIKYKRLHKKDDTYNKKHILEKHKTNDNFINLINPKSLLDVYAWEKFYKKFNIQKYITNDKDEKKETDFNLEAFEFISWFYNKKFDIVDLDPFGSAFDEFDLAIKIAEKWLIITLWELWHRRFKRLDFVKNRYWINDINEDWINKMIDYIINRWLIYKKILKPIYIQDWNNIWRVYFLVEKYKELSQWKK